MDNRDDLKYLHCHHEIASKYIGMARVYLAEGNAAAAAEALDKFCVQSDELTALYQPATAKMMGLTQPATVPVEALKRIIDAWESEAESLTDWFSRVDSDLQTLIDQAERQEK